MVESYQAIVKCDGCNKRETVTLAKQGEEFFAHRVSDTVLTGAIDVCGWFTFGNRHACCSACQETVLRIAVDEARDQAAENVKARFQRARATAR